MDIFLFDVGIFQEKNSDLMFFPLQERNIMYPTRTPIFMMGVGYSVGYGISRQ